MIYENVMEEGKGEKLPQDSNAEFNSEELSAG